jgi:hypothetical protein
VNSNAVEVAKKLHDARECLRALAGDKYESDVLPWKVALADIAQKRGVTEFDALTLTFRFFQDHGKMTTGIGLHLLAAAAELIAEGPMAKREGGA